MRLRDVIKVSKKMNNDWHHKKGRTFELRDRNGLTNATLHVNGMWNSGDLPVEVEDGLIKLEVKDD
jgi:hypothetical protein